MRQMTYVMQFAGQAVPGNPQGTKLKAQATASSGALRTLIGPEGIENAYERADGDEARFESEVSMKTQSTFDEVGTITFGNLGSVRFSTVGEGYLVPTPDSKRNHGCVMWKIEGGDGAFEGASGLITSNVVMTDTGSFTDHHVGTIWLK